MVAEALVTEQLKEPLTQEMVDAGRELTRYLDSRIPITASLWFYFTVPNSWRLLLVSPLVATQGPREMYRQVQSALSRIRQGHLGSSLHMLELDHITVVDDQQDTVKALRAALKVDNDLGGVRFPNVRINGMPIEDSYIYRL